MSSAQHLVPGRLKAAARTAREACRLLDSEVADAIRFARASSALTGSSSADKARARLVMDVHRLEKGLTLRSPRPWFGVEVLERMARLGSGLHEAGQAAETVQWARDAVDDYVEFFQARSEVPMPERIARAVATIRRTGASRPGPERSAGIEPRTERDDLPSLSSFTGLVHNRHSVRNFSDEHVPAEIVDHAIGLASRSPSVCNRQATRVRVLPRGPEMASALQLQNGNAGFGDQAQHLLLITTDLSAFASAGERNQGFIDAGLFAMTLLYALECAGVATCCLNWSVPASRDRALRRRLSLPGHEAVVFMVAVGRPAHDAQVTRSPSAQLSQLCPT